jgi:Arc/MetJ family transcription regulator
MKTTLELPDELLRRTRAAAALSGKSMREFVGEALERHLKQPDLAAWKKVVGKARGLDLAPVKQAISSDFSAADEDSW